jgi:cytochrome c2
MTTNDDRPPAPARERASALETGTATAAVSPLRWLLVIVPLLVFLAAGSYLAVRLATSFQETASEENAARSDRPAAGERSGGERRQAEAPSPAVRREGFEIAAVLALLPHANPEDGEKVFRMCAACHAAEKNGPVSVGNPLWGIVGRRKAAYPGFTYSAALKAKGGVWSYQELAAYLNNPRAYAPGTSMTFAGIVDTYRMADLLAYLRTLSDRPAPLPN